MLWYIFFTTLFHLTVCKFWLRHFIYIAKCVIIGSIDRPSLVILFMKYREMQYNKYSQPQLSLYQYWQ